MFDLDLLIQTKTALRKLAAALSYHSGFVTALQNSAVPPWRILMYHRVIDPERSTVPLQAGMYVRPSTFAQQMEYLAKNCLVIPLDALVKRLRSNEEIPPRTVAITFDDGWHDNYEFAFPILSAHKLEATIFLATMYIGTEEMFWTDGVAVQLRKLWEHRTGWEAPALKESATFDDRAFRTNLIRLQQAGDNSAFDDGLEHFLELLKRAHPVSRTAFLEGIEALLRSSGLQTTASSRLFLNWEEVRSMAKNGITFGSHSHTHTLFTELDENGIHRELKESVAILDRELSATSKVFCYPGGASSELTQQVLGEERIQCALGAVRVSAIDRSPMLLGRIGIHEDVSNTPSLFAYRVWG